MSLHVVSFHGILVCRCLRTPVSYGDFSPNAPRTPGNHAGGTTVLFRVVLLTIGRGTKYLAPLESFTLPTDATLPLCCVSRCHTSLSVALLRRAAREFTTHWLRFCCCMLHAHECPSNVVAFACNAGPAGSSSFYGLRIAVAAALIPNFDVRMFNGGRREKQQPIGVYGGAWQHCYIL